MKIWEALIYGLVAGLTGLLPVSFSGHAAVLQDAFALSPLTQGGGLYVQAAITLGLSAALVLAFPGELQLTCGELARRPQRGKRARQPSPRRRAVLMGLLALPIGLLSLIWCAAAERITRLSLIAAFFCLNGLILFAAGRPGGQKDARALMLPDALLAGATRLAAVLPGLSPLGLTLAVCRLRDLRTDFALRFTAMLALGFSLCEFVYRLLRAVIVGTFSASLWLPMLVALVASTVAGYFALQYLRYLLHREKLRVFSYYCWDAAVIALILALINA